jgi:hypothetical protein
MSMRQLSRLAAGFVLLMQFVSASGSTLVRRENRTCHDYADLDSALDHPSSSYFRGWTTEDFDAAQSWIASCVASPPTEGDKRRIALLAQRRQTLEAAGEVRRNDKALMDVREAQIRDQQEREAQLRAQEEARRAKEAQRLAKQGVLEVQRRSEEAKRRADEARERAEFAAKREARARCLQTDFYQRYAAERHVVEALEQKSRSQQVLEHEERVEELSGTTNLYTKHSAAEFVVSADDDLNKWWAEYRQYGGDASTPQAISRMTKDPCQAVE